MNPNVRPKINGKFELELGAGGLFSIQLGTAEPLNQPLVFAIYSSFIPFGM